MMPVALQHHAELEAGDGTTQLSAGPQPEAASAAQSASVPLLAASVLPNQNANKSNVHKTRMPNLFEKRGLIRTTHMEGHDEKPYRLETLCALKVHYHVMKNDEMRLEQKCDAQRRTRRRRQGNATQNKRMN
jgi:hypothetical protein